MTTTARDRHAEASLVEQNARLLGELDATRRSLTDALTARCGDESHHDDVTLLVLRVPG